MFDDWPLIEASFASQYGIRIEREQDMSYQEFINLINGLLSESPLGKVVSIRAESDRDRLKTFTSLEHQVRNEWRSKCENKYVSSMSKEEQEFSLKALRDAFRKLPS